MEHQLQREGGMRPWIRRTLLLVMAFTLSGAAQLPLPLAHLLAELGHRQPVGIARLVQLLLLFAL